MSWVGIQAGVRWHILGDETEEVGRNVIIEVQFMLQDVFSVILGVGETKAN